MRIDRKNIMYYLPMVILGALLLYLLYWRWQVAVTRFFDVDEFSYLHWAADFAKGERPYTDFFMFFTPGFLWLFAPLISLFSFNPDVFIAARIVSFVIFLGILTLTGTLFGMTRSKRWMLLPVVLLAFLPMPYDKFLETRPDNLATLLALGGLVLEVRALTEEKKNRRHIWFWSGVSYMGSLLVFAKTLPFVVVGILIAFVYPWWGKHISLTAWLKKVSRPDIQVELLAFGMGLVIPFALFLLWLLTLGDIGRAWYSLTKLPFEANMIGRLGWMEPNLFFFPNGSFYGGTTLITNGFIFNHAIWVIGIIVGSIRMVTPFIGGSGDRRKVLSEVLIAGVFVLSVFGYIEFFPLKHSQYLIPIAIFIAYYCADIIVTGLRFVDRHIPVIGITVLLVVGSYYLGKATVQVNQVKLGWSNVVQLTQMKLLTQAIPPGASVLDLDGRLLFWKDAYYICCVPFGSFLPFLSEQPPVLRDVLAVKNVPYIYQGDSNRLYLLPAADLQYIRENYTPVAGWGEGFWVRK